MRLRGVPLYVALSLPFLVLPIALLPFGLDWPVALGVALVTVIAVGIRSTFYMRSRYLASKKPRSIFWGMLVSALMVASAVGLWVGYVVIATLLARDPTFPIQLPIPPQPVRSVITAVAVTALFVAPIYYAVTTYLERRAALREAAIERQIVRERLKHPPGENR